MMRLWVFLGMLVLAGNAVAAEVPSAAAAGAASPAAKATPAKGTVTIPVQEDSGNADAAMGMEEAASPASEAEDKDLAVMRDRWRKMTADQREEMRKKAERRLQEHFDKLSPEEQQQISAILTAMEKLSPEQKSLLKARMRQRFYQEHLDQENQARKLPQIDDVTVKAPVSPIAPVSSPASSSGH